MKILIASATYNESGNIQKLVSEIHKYLPGQEILIVDDNSPDGTGKLLQAMQQKDPLLHVLNRPGKMGLGTAHINMMEFALKHGHDALITMDADFSHNPSYLPGLQEELKTKDFVIGSRYMPGGESTYGFLRTLISRTANFLARFMLAIPLHECTTSYRGYRSELLKKMDLKSIRSNGYSFFVESLFFILRKTKNVVEIPIRFEDRTHGESKINKTEIFKSIIMLFKLLAYRIKN